MLLLNRLFRWIETIQKEKRNDIYINEITGKEVFLTTPANPNRFVFDLPKCTRVTFAPD